MGNAPNASRTIRIAAILPSASAGRAGSGQSRKKGRAKHDHRMTHCCSGPHRDRRGNPQTDPPEPTHKLDINVLASAACSGQPAAPASGSAETSGPSTTPDAIFTPRSRCNSCARAESLCAAGSIRQRAQSVLRCGLSRLLQCLRGLFQQRVSKVRGQGSVYPFYDRQRQCGWRCRVSCSFGWTERGREDQPNR